MEMGAREAVWGGRLLRVGEWAVDAQIHRLWGGREVMRGRLSSTGPAPPQLRGVGREKGECMVPVSGVGWGETGRWRRVGALILLCSGLG